MKKSPLVRTIGSGVFAIGLIAAAATAATADAATQGDANQATAMKRDLGLSTPEVEALYKQQDDARSTESALRSSLGDAFGGGVFDVATGKLTVNITDKSAAPEVRSAGATPNLVDNGQQALDAVMSDLNKEGTADHKGVTSWYTDAESDTVVITVKPGATAKGEQFAKGAGVAGSAVTVKESKAQPRTYADVRGGDAYSTGGGRCSIGFSVEGGFVTAGHCGAEGTQVSSEDGSGTGTVAGSVFPGNDMAHAQTESNWTPQPVVNDYQGGTVTVGGSEETPEGGAICRSGSTTGWHCGTVESKNQSVDYGGGDVVNGLTRTDVCAEPGDSGGSWLTDNQAQGVTSGGSGNCSSGGVTFFQPVNPILDEFGVSLLTG
ncbi:streptogrisin C [Murinocardiopsis flavida]|uniref:Streptogrisin C n=1 Tax=Murinocardiopsis flavida TaxID=645275 RepID=A0A2P8DJH1_9ACTN|nr:S1 family peptidase [Murinocardiopsis flavida]PSK97329.1 streptogrisin C [Murinocardiopsis flavida]